MLRICHRMLPSRWLAPDVVSTGMAMCYGESVSDWRASAKSVPSTPARYRSNWSNRYKQNPGDPLCNRCNHSGGMPSCCEYAVEVPSRCPAPEVVSTAIAECYGDRLREVRTFPQPEPFTPPSWGLSNLIKLVPSTLKRYCTSQNGTKGY
jgi:hypothetical protein